MPSRNRDNDHRARYETLRAFEAFNDAHDADAGLEVLGDLNSARRVRDAISLLVQSKRFHEAAGIIQANDVDCEWIDIAVYALVANREPDRASALIDYAAAHCESWVVSRCRIGFAEAAFSELIDPEENLRAIDHSKLDADEERILEDVIRILFPVVEQVILIGAIETELQHIAVNFTAKAYAALGRLSQIVTIAKPLERFKPVPLLLGQMTLNGVCEPPPGLPSRLRVEHPTDFSAKILAALLDREFYADRESALKSLMRLATPDRKTEEIGTLCQAIFETASPSGDPLLREAEQAIDALLGADNRFSLFFAAVRKLHEEQFAGAIELLEAERRDDEPVWWQILAQAREGQGELDAASAAWDRACQLLPHPAILNHFAGLSIQQHRFGAAAKTIEMLLLQTPDDVELLRKLALTYTKLDDLGNAVRAFEKLTTLEPDTVQHRLNLAICLARLARYEAASAALAPLLKSDCFDAIAIQCEVLNSLGRAQEAFELLRVVKDKYWRDHRFLVLYMSTAYSAGKDKEGHKAFAEILALQKNGSLDEEILHPISLEELVSIRDERRRQRDSLMLQTSSGELPWLFCESLLNIPAVRAWRFHTQELTWLPDDPITRAELGIYATNQFTVEAEKKELVRIEAPALGTTVVADLSALVTLHKLDRLSVVFDSFEKVILPASFQDRLLADSRILAPHQTSHEVALKRIQDAIEQGYIDVVDPPDGTPIVDEFSDSEEPNVFRLKDVKQLLEHEQRITTSESEALEEICHRPGRNDAEQLRGLQVQFDLDTLRVVAGFEWFGRIVPTENWAVSHPGRRKMISELAGLRDARDSHEFHLGLVGALEQAGDRVVWEWNAEMRQFHEKAEDDKIERPPYFDAAMLAKSKDMPLLVDDRVCQANILNHFGRAGCAFGTDRLLARLWADQKLSEDELCRDLLKLIEWRYRFLLLDSHILKALAKKSRGSLPGPELRAVAEYVQDSMRDPGLFCAPEQSEPPMPVAFRYFMHWKETCCEFIALMWGDLMFGEAELDEFMAWVIQDLLPAIPKGLLYSPLGKRMAGLSSTAVLQAAMIQFTTIEQLDRANRGLRRLAELLRIPEHEFARIAGEIAHVRL